MAVLEHERWAVVTCEGCGVDADTQISRQQQRQYRRKPWRCRICHRPALTDERTRYERFWVRQMGSREACVELAELIWGP